MRVCHFVESERFVEGGIKTAIQQQRKAMESTGIAYTTDPTDSFDILHLNVLGPKSLYYFRQAKKQDIPVVVHTHTTGEDFRDSWRFSNLFAPVVDRYTSFIYSKADVLIAPSQYTKQILSRKLPNQRVRVISNGVDTERLQGVEERSRNTGQFEAVNLGITLERKGLDTFTAVGSSLSDIQFTWYGPQLNTVMAPRQTKRYMRNAPENVSFPGFIEDVRDAFARADVFFFPTYEENQGISLLEAAYCGLPIVVRDIETYDDWLEHGKHCLKASTDEEFRHHLQRLKEHPELRERIGTAAQEMAENHALDAVGAEMQTVYADILGKQSTTAQQPKSLQTH